MRRKRLRKNGDWSLIVVKDGKVIFKGNAAGVADLLRLSQKKLLSGAEVYDVKVGLAAAKLLVWSGVGKVNAWETTSLAVKFCRENKVRINYQRLVRRLFSSSEVASCRLEKVALKASSLKELYSELEDFVEVRLAKCPADEVFPLDYYTTSNRETRVNLGRSWLRVENLEMDKGILVDEKGKRAFCVAAQEVRRGDLVVVGELGEGVVEPADSRGLDQDSGFGFMTSRASGERSKEALIAEVADRLKVVKAKKERVLFVGGPAIVHAGAGKYLAKLIEHGYVDVLFAGNGLAAHDLEENYYGTSLGIEIGTARAVGGGYHHHLRTINAVRFFGGIRNFVGRGLVKSGIFYECIRRGVKYVLAGSIRDDGPITDVITDSLEAQMAMRQETRRGFGLVMMVASTLHSVATGNLLPRAVAKVIVDDSLATVTKLTDRGTGSFGIVTDAAYFLSELCRRLKI